ncbi:hypothetical protein IW261DRAFT_1116044 [Armillaria novae-zelandiae]|uniref:Uncharacterized protein n=1 Tax=Armillaria novae-zelandiae TaxID=153914 RepID=A0AA39TU90_9AGAR|nr:hypothetical protein IW261DRAFT_1116044 [Armillaria novae-zelandiae]
MHNQKSAFQNSHVTAQSIRPLWNYLDKPPPVSSYLSYSLPGSLLHIKDPNLPDPQDWFASIDGGGTSFSSFRFGDLHDSIGTKNPSIPGQYSMETSPYLAQNGSYSPIDSLTLVPGTNKVPDIETPDIFGVLAESIRQWEYADIAASGIQTPQYDLHI